jgi:hypothetical protein
VALSQGTVTSAPNFGYALAARKTPPEGVSALNLRHVRILMDAAEPVSAPLFTESRPIVHSIMPIVH